LWRVAIGFTDFKPKNHRRKFDSPYPYPRKIGGYVLSGSISNRGCVRSGTLPLAALPCKVTFQIEPLKDELRTIAVRISDSGILGIPAAGKEKNSRRACPFSCYYSWFWDVLRTFGCNVANARYACRADEGLHTSVHPCQLTTCLPVRVVSGIAFQMQLYRLYTREC